MIPPGRISDRVIVYSGCTTRSLKFQMPPLLLISRWLRHFKVNPVLKIDELDESMCGEDDKCKMLDETVRLKGKIQRMSWMRRLDNTAGWVVQEVRDG